jgi:hypothetical protein
MGTSPLGWKATAGRKVKPSWIIGSMFVIGFVALLLIRLGVFQRGDTEATRDHPLATQTWVDRETWMSISQHGQKIGYSHRQFSRSNEGFRVVESVFMRINMMGMIQDIRYRTEGMFQQDLTFSSFNFNLQSNLFQFKARGISDGKTLILMAGPSGAERRVQLPLERETFLPVGILEILNTKNLKPGFSRTLYVFDPATQASRPLKIAILGEEAISVVGRQENALKVSLDFMGAPQFAWIGKDGTVLKEEGFLGINLEQVTREEALARLPVSAGADLGEIASIPVNRTLDEVHQLMELRVRLDRIETEALFLDGGRQSFRDKVLTIRKESLPRSNSPETERRLFEDGKTYLESTPFIQADHPEILSKTREIVSPSDSVRVKANKLVSWVNRNIQKRPVLSVPNALETLQRRLGDCNEHAVLLAALTRAAGIPAQVEAGLVYQEGRFYYHAWNILYVGSWMTADAVMNQLPADVTHIRLVRGMERQVDLMSVIGRVKLEILKASFR